MMDLLADIQFMQPLWLLLMPITGLLLLYIHLTKHTPVQSLTSWIYGLARDVYRHPLFSSLKPKQATTSAKKRRRWIFNYFNYFFLFSCISLSLAQPFKIGQQLPDPPEYRDIVFIVDTSVSMVLRDYLVNGIRTQRMTVLKNVLTHFVDQLEGNRIQIIAYSEQAYTLVPLTTDYELIKFQLQRLEPASLTGRSSDLGRALLYALQPYKNIPTRQVEKNDNSRPVFVMLTDADRPVRDIDPRVAAEQIANHNIRLHTIAIGAGSYEAEDKENISLIYHPTSFYLLEQIAQQGKGQFFWAKDSDTLRDALRSINNAEKRKVDTPPQFIQQPLYFWPLAIAMLWLLILHTYELLFSGFKSNQTDVSSTAHTQRRSS